jgi:hypothetical protein
MFAGRIKELARGAASVDADLYRIEVATMRRYHGAES